LKSALHEAGVAKEQERRTMRVSFFMVANLLLFFFDYSKDRYSGVHATFMFAQKLSPNGMFLPALAGNMNCYLRAEGSLRYPFIIPEHQALIRVECVGQISVLKLKSARWK
jgi:hypothetical protein